MYSELLKASHEYEGETRAVLEGAGFLLDDLLSELEGLPVQRSDSERSGLRRAVSLAADPQPVAAAARQVELEGPSSVAAAARVVQAAAEQLGATLSVAVVQVAEDPTGSLVIRRPLALPDSQVVTHAPQAPTPH
ncbi:MULTISPECIES: hypothetical protein [unclassified Streptomyces]|uniref:hypothetical protein n=1 Tax=unclassified Streptomyces TaxID=2593676 RepID=UPI00159F0588|nr:hypothetical protein [Streptomyces sp. MnatMP-M77]